MIQLPPGRMLSKLSAFALFALSISQISLADQVRVIADEAHIKLGTEVLATLKKGDEVPVITQNGSWLGVKVQTDEGEKIGWVHSKYVEKVVAGKPKPAIETPVMTEPEVKPKPPATVEPEVTPEPVATEVTAEPETTTEPMATVVEPAPAIPSTEPLKLGAVQKDCVVMLRINGANPALKGTALNSIWHDPETREFLAQPLALMEQFLTQMAPMTGVNIWDLLALLKTDLVLTLYDVNTGTPEAPAPPSVKALLALKTGEADSAADKAVRGLIDFLKLQAPEGMIQEGKAGDADTLTMQSPAGVVKAAFLKEWFVIATGEGLFDAVVADPAAALPKDPIQQANPESMPNDGILTLFYNNKKALELAGGFMPGHVKRELAKTGLDKADWAYVTVRPHGRGFKTTLAISGGDGELPGFMSIFQTAGKPLSTELLASVPRDCQFFTMTSYDVKAGYDRLRAFLETQGGKDVEEFTQGIQKAEETIGFSIRDDLLASLGNEILLVTRPGSYLFIPGFVAQFQLADADKFDECLESLVQVANDALAKEKPAMRGGGPVQLRRSQTQYQDTTINILNFDNLPIPLSPAFAVRGDRLIVGLFPHTLKDYLAFLNKGGPDIRSNADFRAVRAQLPEQVSSLVYGDLKANMLNLYVLLPMAAAAVNGIPQNPIKFDVGKCPTWSAISKYLFGTAAVTYWDEGRMVYEIYSPIVLPVCYADTNMGSLATTSILAGMLLPALARARGEARSMKCKNNLRQLGTAAIQYIDQFGKGRYYPKTLATLYTSGLLKQPDLFGCPQDAPTTDLVEGVKTSYESAFDRAGEDYQFLDKTPSNLILIWEKSPTHRGRRNVAFFDAHVETMNETQFEQALKRLDEYLAKEKAPKE